MQVRMRPVLLSDHLYNSNYTVFQDEVQYRPEVVANHARGSEQRTKTAGSSSMAKYLIVSSSKITQQIKERATLCPKTR